MENSGQQAIDALAEIIEQQQRLVPFCAADNTTANLLLDTLDEALIYARHEIQVLVTGAFASGKASLLKALFGEEYPSRMKDVIQQIERINEQLSTQIEKQYSVDIPDEERTSGVFRDRSEELLGAQMQIELIKQELNGLSEYFE